MQAEAEGVIALHDDFRNERAAQLCVGVVEEVRPILQQGYQFLRPLGGGIPSAAISFSLSSLACRSWRVSSLLLDIKMSGINEAVFA